jgi:hypothetical protein
MRLTHLALVALCSLAAGTSALSDECDPNDPTLLKPNLAARPTRVRTLRYGTNRRLLTFSTTFSNTGQGPFIVQGHTIDMPGGQVTQATQEIWRTDGSTCTHLVGLFEHNPADQHWHIENFAAYQLRKDDPFTGAIVAESSKSTFCLEDDRRIRGFTGKHQLESDCSSPEGLQGISAGYFDVYRSFLPNQWIDLDADPDNPVPPGKYFLVNVPDPDNQVLKTSADPATDYGVVNVKVRQR